MGQPVRDNLVDLYGKEEASLQHSIRAVDDMEQIGGIVLRSLGKQKEHIKVRILCGGLDDCLLPFIMLCVTSECERSNGVRVGRVGTL